MPRPVIPYRPEKTENSPMMRRTLMLAAAFAFWVLLIAARLYYLQIIEYVHWLDRAQRQQQRTIELAPQRGTIYDSRMRPLAMSLPVDSVYAVPSHLEDPSGVARALAPILGLRANSLEARFDSSSTFCWVKRKITAAQSAQIRALNLKGIYFQKETKRFYPMNGLAASVAGYVGMDDKGLGGIEQSLNSVIRGQPGHALVVEDARRQTFETRDDPGKPGANIVLTIDSGLQYIAQRVLDADVAKWRAKGGVVVVQNPETGAILAMASNPSFNPNDYAQSPPEDRLDKGIGWIYEPGSAFKLITISSVIGAGVARPSEIVNCQMGVLQLGGRTIHDASDDVRREREYGSLMTVSQVFEYSSNVGTAKLALRLGEDRFYQDIRNFGIGQKTGIALPGEERGELMPPQDWSGVSIGEFAIGQGVGVTPLQLADAYSAVANGGIMTQPRIVKSILGGENSKSLPPQWSRRVVTPQTAAIMRQMMAGVVQFGTGVAAQLDGYSAGGKTGTAQKVENKRYSHTDFVASFIGVAPLSHPSLTILISIDTPVGGHYGAEVAAPAWREIAQESLNYLNVPRDQPLTPPTQFASNHRFDVPLTTAVQPANFETGSSISPEPQSPLDAPPAGIAPAAPPTPASNKPSGPAGNADGRTVVINAGPTVTIPDFSGLDERKTADECQALGLQLTLSGSGIATQQDPAPGSKVPEGSKVQVAFARWAQ
ncbi:MAG TPA: penicillin-binding protein [Terriglobia bacterium]|nr:penicillin-binding protein [Terriglobia bacterium]